MADLNLDGKPCMNASLRSGTSFVSLTAVGSRIRLIRDVAGTQAGDGTRCSVEDEWISIWKC